MASRSKVTYEQNIGINYIHTLLEYKAQYFENRNMKGLISLEALRIRGKYFKFIFVTKYRKGKMIFTI